MTQICKSSSQFKRRNEDSVCSIVKASEAIKTFLKEKEGFFDEDNSIVFFNKDTHEIYAYILTEIKNIPYIDFVFNQRPDIVNLLSIRQGLYIKKAVFNYVLPTHLIVNMLNILHLTYCHEELSDNTKYVWADVNEVLFALTEQKDGFFHNANNNVSSTFFGIMA